jgi:arginine-tRNA-protein transferase
VSVRIKAKEFRPSRNLRRISELNRDLVATITQAEATSEQYDLFRRYLDARHSDGGMADMTAADYALMVEDSHVESRIIEYRLSRSHGTAGGRRTPLVAACLTDLLADGLSMVYSFYAPFEQRRSYGTHMILDHIERAQRLGLPHVYLGYWVEGSPKMAYKGRFLPQERLGVNGWERVG